MFVFIISFIVTCVLFFNWLEDESNIVRKYLIRSFLVFCTSLVLYVFTPSDTTVIFKKGLGH